MTPLHPPLPFPIHSRIDRRRPKAAVRRPRQRDWNRGRSSDRADDAGKEQSKKEALEPLLSTVTPCTWGGPGEAARRLPVTGQLRAIPFYGNSPVGIGRDAKGLFDGFVRDRPLTD